MVSTEEQSSKQVLQAAMVAIRIREALQASLPVAPEQMITIQIPGTVIDTRDEGPYFWDERDVADTPHRIKVNEARLVDGMVPLSKIMMGPTGKSVARSYAAALDMLIPEDAPIDMPSTGRNPVTIEKTAAAERYIAAMKYLTEKAPNSPKSVIDVYVEKQEAWSEAMKDWDKAKQTIRDEAKKLYSLDTKKQQAHFDDWNQANFRNFKNHAQAKYMDWIVNGNKYKVDYYFGIVDVSSAMKRVESSKEASRNLVVIDPDGTTEWQQVKLNPTDWARLCKEKVDAFGQNEKPTRKEYESEIKRLRRLLLSYDGLRMALGDEKPKTEQELAAATKKENEEEAKKIKEAGEKKTKEEEELKELKGTIDGTKKTAEEINSEAKAKQDILIAQRANTAGANAPTDNLDLVGAEKDLAEAYQKLYKAQNAKPKDGMPQNADEIKTAQLDVEAKLKAFSKEKYEKNQENVEKSANENKNDKVAWVKRMIADVREQLDALQRDLKGYDKENVASAAIQDVKIGEPGKNEAVTTEYADAGSQYAQPAFNIPRNGVALSDAIKKAKPSPWTKISVSISTTEQEKARDSQSSSTSVAASYSAGPFSASGGFNYSQASAKASDSAANCNVDISFEALLVTIDRPWLHGELFADMELNVAPSVALSPGPDELKKAIDRKDHKALQQFAYFPSYPTAFIIASNVELEFRGDTTHLEDAVESSSFDANLKVGYGPFSLSASHKQEKSSSKTKMETTAVGTKIKLEAPSIIGWVTTLLPALPRNKDMMKAALVGPLF